MRTRDFEPEQTAVQFGESHPEWTAVADPDEEQVDLPGCYAGEALHNSLAANRDNLILQHLPTVRFIAKRVCERMPQHVDLDELISAGLAGLVDAATKFDSSKQVQFKSYAQFRIRGAILDSLRLTDWSPRELRRKGRAVAEAIRGLSARLNRTPSDAEIAREMGLDLLIFQQVTGELKGLELGSLNLPRTEDVGEEELDYVPAPANEDPLTRLIEGQTRERLAAAIELLPERERLTLTLYYFEELTMKEIGLVLGVVESRVSQIRTSAVSRLRTNLTVRPNQATSRCPRRRLDSSGRVVRLTKAKKSVKYTPSLQHLGIEQGSARGNKGLS